MDKKTYLFHVQKHDRVAQTLPTVNRLVGNELVRTNDVEVTELEPDSYSIDSLIAAGLDPHSNTVEFQSKDSLNDADVIFSATESIINEVEKSQNIDEK